MTILLIALFFIGNPFSARTIPAYAEIETIGFFGDAYDYYDVSYDDLTSNGLNEICELKADDTKVIKIIIEVPFEYNIKTDYFFNYVYCHAAEHELLLMVNEQLNREAEDFRLISNGVRINSITFYGVDGW